MSKISGKKKSLNKSEKSLQAPSVVMNCSCGNTMEVILPLLNYQCERIERLPAPSVVMNCFCGNRMELTFSILKNQSKSVIDGSSDSSESSDTEQSAEVDEKAHRGARLRCGMNKNKNVPPIDNYKCENGNKNGEGSHVPKFVNNYPKCLQDIAGFLEPERDTRNGNEVECDSLQFVNNYPEELQNIANIPEDRILETSIWCFKEKAISMEPTVVDNTDMGRP